MVVTRAVLDRFSIKGEKSLCEFGDFESKTAISALANYIINADPKNFQPMKINFGIFDPLSEEERQKYCVSNKRSERRLGFSKRALDLMSQYFDKNN